VAARYVRLRTKDSNSARVIALAGACFDKASATWSGMVARTFEDSRWRRLLSQKDRIAPVANDTSSPMVYGCGGGLILVLVLPTGSERCSTSVGERTEVKTCCGVKSGGLSCCEHS